MQTTKTIYWYDFESFGSDPARDRACQFAGLRTDENLNIIDDPLLIYCSPALDMLPDPEACLITGITPQLAREEGCQEAEFAARIHAEFSEPQTCVAGYNNLRFDDEMTRQLLYRSFFDPYAREWKNGNSRWDIIDLTRMCYALRPDGINWPVKESGLPSFKLEDLTRANGIGHEDAHDALADVHATIALAGLIRERQPRLYDYYYRKRSKNAVLAMFNLSDPQPLLHISSRYPASRGCLAVVLPLLQDPGNPNAIIVYDLTQDPSVWLTQDAASIKQNLFTASVDLPEGTERIALKTVHSNRCPALAPLSTLTDDVASRFQIDLDACEKHRKLLLQQGDLRHKLAEVFRPDFKPERDPDRMLYSGGFFDDHDRRLMERLRALSPGEMATTHFDFHDGRLPELLFRYRGRNYPDSFSEDEKNRWYEFCRQKHSGADSGYRSIAGVRSTIADKRQSANGEQALLLDELSLYIDELCRELSL